MNDFDHFQLPLETAVKHAFRHLQCQDTRSVATTDELAVLREKLDVPLTRSGLAAEEVVEELVEAVNGGILGSAGQRFFGWVMGGSLPAALAADWLTSVWDQNAALYACAPAAAVIEEVVGKWLKALLRIPAEASFALVSGCQMAHLTCLLAARYWLLERRSWNVEEAGLFGAPVIRVLTSLERHGSIIRAVRMLGIGEHNVHHLRSDEAGRLALDEVQRVLATDPDLPTILVLQAGDLNIGAFDSFETIIPVAKKFGAWVHVDGAFGLWAAASTQHRTKMQGAEMADSWSTDGHKWLNVPYDSGYAFIRESNAHKAALSHRADYITHDKQARDQMDWNPEWSRRARGFATYAAIRQLGEQGIEDLVDRCCRFAQDLVLRIGALPNAEVVWKPTLNQGLVRFKDPDPAATEEDHTRVTEEIMAQILKTGEAFFTGTTWQGKRAMRVSVCNWQTSAVEITRVVDAIKRMLRDKTA